MEDRPEPFAWFAPAPLPANRELLAHLAGETPSRQPQPGQAKSHRPAVHPDLIERIIEAVGDLDAVQVHAFGAAALAHPNGVIFAIARGTLGIALRLPRSALDAVMLDTQHGELGRDWVWVNPWPFKLGERWVSMEHTMQQACDRALHSFRTWMRQAYDYAATLADGDEQ